MSDQRRPRPGRMEPRKGGFVVRCKLCRSLAPLIRADCQTVAFTLLSMDGWLPLQAGRWTCPACVTFLGSLPDPKPDPPRGETLGFVYMDEEYEGEEEFDWEELY